MMTLTLQGQLKYLKLHQQRGIEAALECRSADSLCNALFNTICCLFCEGQRCGTEQWSTAQKWMLDNGADQGMLPSAFHLPCARFASLSAPQVFTSIFPKITPLQPTPNCFNSSPECFKLSYSQGYLLFFIFSFFLYVRSNVSVPFATLTNSYTSLNLKLE